jgi:hypothetical protein
VSSSVLKNRLKLSTASKSGAASLDSIHQCPHSEFHDSVNNELDRPLLSTPGKSHVLNVVNGKSKESNGKILHPAKSKRFVYGTKKNKDARKTKKRCVEGCDMYIVRVKKDTDDWAMSRPCKECWEVMHTLGIRKVYYTTADGKWMSEKVSNMEITHRSSGVLALQAYREQERAEKAEKARRGS